MTTNTTISDAETKELSNRAEASQSMRSLLIAVGVTILSASLALPVLWAATTSWTITL